MHLPSEFPTSVQNNFEALLYTLTLVIVIVIVIVMVILLILMPRLPSTLVISTGYSKGQRNSQLGS